MAEPKAKHRELIQIMMRCGLIALLLSAVSCQSAAVRSSRFIAHKGVLDLRDFHPGRDGMLRMEGEWEVYAQQLLAPADFAHEKVPVGRLYIDVPSFTPLNSEQGEKSDGRGYATYRLKIITDDQAELLLGDINAFYHFRLFIDGQLRRSGKMDPPQSDEIMYLDLDNHPLGRSATHEVIIQVANYLPTAIIVAAEPLLGETIGRQLANRGLLRDYDMVAEAAAADEILSRKNPKLIIVGASSHSIEGNLALLSWMARNRPECKRIFLAGAAEPEWIERALNEGQVDHVINQPTDTEHFATVIAACLADSRVKGIVAAAAHDENYLIKPWHLDALPDMPDTDGDTDLAERTAAGNGELILLIDDLADIRRHVGKILANHGYRVVCADNGATGLQKAKYHHPDLIITDWMMPQVSGVALIEQLRQDAELSGCPTILLTAKSDEESRRLGAQTGANAYLGKPFDELELISTVRNLLELKKGEARILELNRRLTENVLSRFLPPQLVNDIVEGRATMDLSPRLQSITIMFSDLTDFTRITTLLGPQRMAEVLGKYFDSMSEVVFAHGGIVDKFIGDGIMAIFGAPAAIPVAQQVKQAWSCAMAMHQALKKLNEEFQAQGVPLLKMRIGINQGPAVIGGFGGRRRMEYTAIGSVVNVASRIESVAEPGSIYFSDTVRDYLDDGNWELAGTFRLKGIGDEFPLFRGKKAA